MPKNGIVFPKKNKHEMNFIPNKRKREREKFCVINVKYKENSWRVRRRRRKEEK